MLPVFGPAFSLTIIYKLELNICTCCSTFLPLLHRRNAAITGLVCRLLIGEGRRNLHYFCPLFCGTDDTRCRSSCLHTWDPADHLHLIDPCNFLTDLDTVGKFRLFVSGTLSGPADILLSGDNYGWRTMYCMITVVHVAICY